MAAVYAGGISGNAGIPSIALSHLGAREVKNANWGVTRLGSCMLPAGTTIMPGKASTTEQIGEPHTLQNDRDISLPLSALDVYVVSGPVTVNAWAANAALVAWPVPEYFWQSVQWHCATWSGGSESE